MSTHDKMLREWLAKRIPGDLCGLQLGQGCNRVTMVNRVDTRAGSINTVARIDHADAVEAMATACLFAAAPAVAEEVLRLRAEREALYLAVGNLLAVIHRDGGHHMAEHGVEASCAAAERVVCDERARLDAVEHAAREHRDATEVMIGAWTVRDGTRAEHWIAADRSRREAADAQAQTRVVLDRVIGGGR